MSAFLRGRRYFVPAAHACSGSVRGCWKKKDLDAVPDFPKNRIDYPSVLAFKTALLDKALKRLRHGGARAGFERFCVQHAPWLDDFARFTAFANHYGKSGKIRADG